MTALENLRSSKRDNRITQAYLDKVLREESENIISAQDRLISKFNIQKDIPEIGRRSFVVSSGKAEFTQPLRLRFLDMKKNRGFKGKSIPLHNKVIYGHFNNIINRLAFGLTDDTKELISQEFNIPL